MSHDNEREIPVFYPVIVLEAAGYWRHRNGKGWIRPYAGIHGSRFHAYIFTYDGPLRTAEYQSYEVIKTKTGEVIRLHFDRTIKSEGGVLSHTSYLDGKAIRLLYSEIQRLKQINSVPRHCAQCGKFGMVDCGKLVL